MERPGASTPWKPARRLSRMCLTRALREKVIRFELLSLSRGFWPRHCWSHANIASQFPELSQLEDLQTSRIVRILTVDFPHYFAVVSRIRQEVHAVGPEGGTVSSSAVPQVQAVFPQAALTKKIRVGLQVFFCPSPPAVVAIIDSFNDFLSDYYLTTSFFDKFIRWTLIPTNLFDKFILTIFSLDEFSDIIYFIN